jgi:hypothetical protein
MSKQIRKIPFPNHIGEQPQAIVKEIYDVLDMIGKRVAVNTLPPLTSDSKDISDKVVMALRNQQALRMLKQVDKVLRGDINE